jgi:hypothetical protein
MNNYLILRTLISPYGDTTKGSVLSQSELDDNFIFLKGNVIYTALTDNGIVTLKKYNGEDLVFSGGTGGGGTGSDSYWTSGSTGAYSIISINDSGLDATANYAVAINHATLASGIYSFAAGVDTTASGSSSSAFGVNTIAGGTASHAQGSLTKAMGENSHAEGRETIAGGDYSHAEGWSSIATGATSHAEGELTKAYGNASHAEGGSTIASGIASHAEGNGTIASGDMSHSEGTGTLASGNQSHAGGEGVGSNYVIANGISSFAHQFVSGNGQFGPGNYGTYGNYSAILGGQDHYVSSGSESGAIMGGNGHLLYGISLNSAIFGGNANLLIDTYNGVVIGGTENGTIQADSSAIVGGYNNLIDAYYYSTEPYAFIGGGYNNKIITGGGTTGEASAIIGGNGNTINGDNEYVGIYNSFGSTATSQSASAIISSYESTIEDMIGAGSSYNNVIIGAYNSRIEASGMSYVSILGGANNNIYQDNSFGGVVPNYSVIIGGDTNRIDDSDTATIINGFSNTASTNSKQSTIINGQFHSITSSQFSAIIGGNNGEMTDSNGSAIIGGSENKILSDGNPAFTRYYNAILGGTGNTINNSELSFIMGGYQNVIPYGKVGVVILGGDSITGSTNNTVYVQRLNIKNAVNDNTTTRFLTLDANNNIAFRNLSSISGATSGSTGGDTLWASGTTGTGSIKAINTTGLDANGNYAVAINNATMADGENSFAAGFSTWARGTSSMSVGQNTESFGDYTFAGGDNTIATGNNSFIWSTESTVTGLRSAVIGGSYINGLSADTVYVPFLNIQSATTNNTLTTFLVRNSDGTIRVRDLSSITATTVNTTNITTTNLTATTITSTTVNSTNVNTTNLTATTVSSTTVNTTNVNTTNINTSNLTATTVSSTTVNTTNVNTTNINASSLTSTTISATTYLNLPIDIRVTGATYSNNTFTYRNNTGGTFNVLFNTMTGLTINGNLTYTGQTNNPIYTAGTVTSTHIPNWNNSNVQHVILSAATTNISGGTNILNGAIYTMILKQNASGSRVVNWASQYKWQSGIAPVLTSTANGVDILTFISDGTNMYGLIAKDFR